MTRKTKLNSKDGRRCYVNGCHKLAKDKIDGKYLCRVHSPVRNGYQKETKEKNK